MHLEFELRSERHNDFNRIFFFSPKELGMYSIVFLRLLVKLDVEMRVLDI